MAVRHFAKPEKVNAEPYYPTAGSTLLDELEAEEQAEEEETVEIVEKPKVKEEVKPKQDKEKAPEKDKQEEVYNPIY